VLGPKKDYIQKLKPEEGKRFCQNKCARVVVNRVFSETVVDLGAIITKVRAERAQNGGSYKF